MLFVESLVSRHLFLCANFSFSGFKNLICDCIFVVGLIDYLQEYARGSSLFGFRGGPAGIMKGKYIELTSEFVYPYRNQV